MPWRNPRFLVLCAAFLGGVALFAVRDLPAQMEKLRREHRILSGLSNEARRIEVWRPEPGDRRMAQHYVGLHAYLQFMALIRERTPADARVGLLGLPADFQAKFAHYFLFPRHPFHIDRRDLERVTQKLRLDHVARLEPSGAGSVERVR